MTGSYNRTLVKNNTPAKDEHEWLRLHQPFTLIANNFL